MSADAQAADAARDILARWAGSMPGSPLPDFKAKFSLLSAQERPVYVCRLMTLYDSRGPDGDCVVPVRDGAPAPSTNIWAYPVKAEADFIRTEVRIGIPMSADRSPCPKCEGAGSSRCAACAGARSIRCPECTVKGKKSCPECAGEGKLACTHCQGTGWVTRSVSNIGLKQRTPCQNCSGTGGPPCPRCAAEKADCPACNNTRRVNCPQCRGQGGTACPACEGGRQVLKARSYRVELQPILIQDARSDPEAPEGLLPAELPREVLGKVVYRFEADKIGALEEPLPREDLAKAVEGLSARAEAGKKDFSNETRIVRQRLEVDRIPAYFAVYEYGGRKYNCWATAFQDRVLAAQSPFTELASGFLAEAAESLSRREYSSAEELLEKAAPLAPWPWLSSLGRHAGDLRSSGSEGASLAAGLAVVAAAAAAACYASGPSHSLAWPLLVTGALACIAPAFYVLAGGPERPRGPAASSVVGALSAAAFFGAFWLRAPARRLDAREYAGLLARRFPHDLPEILSPEDEGYLKLLVAAYEPLGVDVGAIKRALEANSQHIEAARQEALREKQARAAQAAAAAKKKREYAAAKAAAAREAARAKAKAAKSKKKKKK